MINIGQPKIFTVLTSIAIIMIYLAYLMVTGPMLKKRLQGQWPPKDLKEGGYFTMGRWGMLVNIFAVVWGVVMALNLAWPRAAVYGEPWYNTWGAFVYIGVILGSGLLWYFVKGRHHIGTLESHAATTKAEVQKPSSRREWSDAGTFDYVIAGGGTAGCALAARLSEDPDVTVCLVEAGPDRRRRRQHPGAVASGCTCWTPATTGTTRSNRRSAATRSCATPGPRCSAAARRTTRASRSCRPRNAWTSGWRWAPTAGVPPRSCR